MKRIVSIFFAVFLCFSLAFSVSAAETLDNSTFNSYTYWLGYDEKTLVPTKSMYSVERILDGSDFGYKNFAGPIDVKCDDEGNIYILENIVSRITILDKSFNVINSITSIKNGDESIDFMSSSGLFVDKEKRLYIADTEHSRVIVSDDNGNYISELVITADDIVPKDFMFQPSRITVDTRGNIYVLSKGSTYGALLFNSDYEFEGFYGANVVNSTIADVFGKVWDLIFTTDEMKAGQESKIPYQFTDICSDKEGFIYTVTGFTNDSEAKGQIKCLGPYSTNLLRVKQNISFEDSNSFNFADTDNSTYKLKKVDFNGISVDEDGLIYALDTTFGRIFIYDSECNLLSTVGGGFEEGTQKGNFTSASSVAVFNNKLFVTDTTLSRITIYKETDYGTALKNADKMYLMGNYQQGRDEFEKLLQYDKNCQIAYRGLAKACLLDGDYDNALYYSECGLDYDTYDQSLEYVRMDFLNKNFTWILIVVLVIVALVIISIIYFKKNNIKLIKNYKLKVMLESVVHPFNSAYAIKSENAGSYLFAVICLALFYLTTVAKDIYSGFLYNRFNAEIYNSLMTLIGSLGVVILWSICFWGMTMLFSGKSTFKHSFVIASYAMIPQIVANVLFLVLSHFLVGGEATILTVITVISLIISGIMICVQNMVANEYNFFKFLGVTLVTVIAMGICIFVLFMIMILLQQLYSFMGTLFMEVAYR